MKVLFLMRTPVHTGSFDSVLRALAERGHSVHVGFESREPKRTDDADHITRICREHPGITYGDAHPTLRRDPLAAVARRFRGGIDYLGYLEPRYQGAEKLRQRAAGFAPRLVRWLATLPPLNTSRGRALLRRLLRALERAIPSDPGIDEYLRSNRPDIVLAAPLVMFGTNQIDYLRAARALGMRTGLCVYSWDSLTNKGVMHEVPDLVTVWNEIQRREAVELHGVPASRVVVTGAPSYDHWFGWTPSTGREEFCRQVGLAPERPIVLFVGSSRFVAPDETSFVRKWVRALRAEGSDPAVREAGILVRPHPLNPCWRDADLPDLRGVAVWPPTGALPADDEARNDLFDSVHHAAAVVGVNTSAMIDTAIINRPVLTWLAPGFQGVQEGTPHFHYLTAAEGGPASVAASLEEHTSQLAETVGQNGAGLVRNRHFVRSFIRPHGLDGHAAARVVAAVEQAVGRPAPQPRPRRLSATAHRGLSALASRLLDLVGRGRQDPERGF